MKDTTVNMKYSPMDGVGPSVHSTILIDPLTTTPIHLPDNYTLDEICPINRSVGMVFHLEKGWIEGVSGICSSI